MPMDAALTTKPVLAVFLDTNFFYNFGDIETIPWCQELKAPSLFVIITPVVLGELNDHKDGGRKAHLTERAQSAIRLINRIVDEHPSLTNHFPVRDGVQMVIDGPLSGADAAVLPADNNDHRLVNAAIRYKRLFPEHHTGVLTEDIGLKLACRSNGITVFSLPDRLRKPAPVSTLVKALRKLEAEVEHLKAALPAEPVLAASFDDGTDARRLTPDAWISHVDVYPDYVAVGTGGALPLPQRARLAPRTAALSFSVVNSGSSPAANYQVRLWGEPRVSFRLPNFAAGDAHRGVHVPNPHELVIRDVKLQHGDRMLCRPVLVTFLGNASEHRLKWECAAENMRSRSRGELIVLIDAAPQRGTA